MARQLRSATKALGGDPNAEAPPREEKVAPVHKRNPVVSSHKRKLSTNAPATSRTFKATRVEKKPSTKPKKSSAINLGQSPYPDHPYPTPAQCQLVHDLLTEAHGPAIRPTTITASVQHAGCGEVPSVLDSLLRTVLSANTSASNSSRAFRGLLKKYGSDVEHGGVNWEGVRNGTMKDLFKAIESGGLANVKSKTIMDILVQVHEEGEKTKAGRLSLDYLHESTDEEAMRKLTSFKGVGVKTATCVLMFCLRRSAFPVDTHVFRISKLLGWVPTPGYQREVMELESKIAPLEIEDEDEEHELDDTDKKTGLVGIGNLNGKPGAKRNSKRTPPVTRDTTFLHLDTKVPPDLKYGLHQLMIRHGRYCPTCNAAGGRKFGIGQNGKPLVAKTKSITVKEEKEDGTFEEKSVETIVKEEPADSDEEGYNGGGGSAGTGESYDLQVKAEEASELNNKPSLPIDAAGGTGEKTGGNPDGSCILGDMISWERLI
ncbi:hypothetical protein H072_4005 [Dactylellina haptotyla CBS 200.50]|uniref:HhH-GPD domain-containing protein n=1 Tax=Dactylellina haptotyla (strain CBS 200.50) TaxID=1284197 RepID=S8AG26_DACHA|nr:hypothetical protein H072_4005 [Dactylellina haptotyla CBS 200.50]